MSVFCATSGTNCTCSLCLSHQKTTGVLQNICCHVIGHLITEGVMYSSYLNAKQHEQCLWWFIVIVETDWLMLGITHAIETLFEMQRNNRKETVLFILDSKHLQVSDKHDDDLTITISSFFRLVLLYVSPRLILSLFYHTSSSCMISSNLELPYTRTPHVFSEAVSAIELWPLCWKWLFVS